MIAPAGFVVLQMSKYSGTCRWCGAYLPAGSRISWSKSTGAILCSDCSVERPGPTQTDPFTTPSADPNHQWKQLVGYLKRCVTLESADGLVDFGDTRWAALSLTSEELISGTGAPTPITPEIEAMAKRLEPGQVLQYGWPTVVVIDRNGVQRLAPLLVTELENPEPGDTEISASDDPYLNPSIVAAEHFDTADVDEMCSIFDNGIPSGQPDSLARLLDLAATALGLTSPGSSRATLEINLPSQQGLHNTAVVIKTESSNITRTLIQELSDLEDRTDWRGTAAAHLFKDFDPKPSRPVSAPLIAPVPLNDSQEQLALRISDAHLTVATGPPGTGKSQLVVAGVANSWMRNESILLVSTNNAAVDVATDRVADVAVPALVRTGNKTFRDAVPALVSQALSYAQAVEIDEASARRDLALVVVERENALANVVKRSQLDVSLRENLIDAERGALAVWGSERAPATADLNETRMRILQARRAWFFRKRRQRRLLNFVGAIDDSSFEMLAHWAEHRSLFEQQRIDLADLIQSTDAVNIQDINERWHAVSRLVMQARVAQSITAADNRISALGIQRGGGPGFANAVENSLNGLRGWACTALTLKQNLPLKAGLFDHVIIDEASQCTLAAVLPAAYRAKRLTVVGDPNQLSPIIGLNSSLVRDIAIASGLEHSALAQNGLDYRTGSAFSAFAAAAGSDDVQLLDEHYRCHPLIARWFNATFYGGRLTVLTDVGKWPAGQRGLQWIDTHGVAERPPNSSSINRHEAEIVVDSLDTLLQGDLSVGVVTPFSGQAQLIRRMAERRFGKERLGESDFTVGTAHRFQGDERDVILFSTVIAPGIRPRTAQWVENQRNLLNVGASRARRVLMVFGHPTAAGEFNVPTLSSLRSAAMEGPTTADAAWAIHSEAEARLLSAMYEAGLAPVLKPHEEGFELDFAIVTPSIKLNVEVDGSQHFDVRGRQHRRDIARDRILSGLGWTVVRYPSWKCMEEAADVAAAIAAAVASASDEG